MKWIIWWPLVAALGCGGATTLGGGDAAIDAQDNDALAGDASVDAAVMNHRATATPCPQARGPGDPAPQATIECTTDSECDAGVNGRCLPPWGGAFMNHCSYDTCFQDSQCAPGQVCWCRASGTDNAPNFCTSGNCQVDSDCATGACSPSPATMVSQCTVAYYCHTPLDQCTNDSDCASGTSGGLCAYDVTNKRWACSNTCPPPP